MKSGNVNFFSINNWFIKSEIFECEKCLLSVIAIMVLQGVSNETLCKSFMLNNIASKKSALLYGEYAEILSEIISLLPVNPVALILSDVLTT